MFLNKFVTILVEARHAIGNVNVIKIYILVILVNNCRATRVIALHNVNGALLPYYGKDFVLHIAILDQFKDLQYGG